MCGEIFSWLFTVFYSELVSTTSGVWCFGFVVMFLSGGVTVVYSELVSTTSGVWCFGFVVCFLNGFCSGFQLAVSSVFS